MSPARGADPVEIPPCQKRWLVFSQISSSQLFIAEAVTQERGGKCMARAGRAPELAWTWSCWSPDNYIRLPKVSTHTYSRQYAILSFLNYFNIWYCSCAYSYPTQTPYSYIRPAICSLQSTFEVLHKVCNNINGILQRSLRSQTYNSSASIKPLHR